MKALFVCFVVVSGWSTWASPSVPNVEAGRVYRLAKGNDSRACLKSITPVVRQLEDGRTSLVLHSRLGFTWEAVNDNRQQQGGCLNRWNQIIEDHGQFTRLTVTNSEECPSGQPAFAGSMREILILTGRSIMYRAEPLNPVSRASVECRWNRSN